MYLVGIAGRSYYNKDGQKIIQTHEATRKLLMSDDEIVGVNIPTGVPLVYEFDDNFNVLNKYYLLDEAELKARMEAVANQGKAK